MSPIFDGSRLLEPVTPEEPGGKNPEEGGALGLLEAYQVFGQSSLEPEPEDASPPARRESRKSDRPPNWEEIRDLSLETLNKCRDLRVLAHLGAALVRTDGLQSFVGTLSLASSWLTTFWANVYPVVDEGDALSRQNALNCFADRVAIIDGLRREPLVSSRKHGRFSLRDLEILAGSLQPGGAEARPDEAQVGEAFAEMPFADLKALQQSAVSGLASLRAIDETMREHAGSEAAPAFESLAALLQKMDASLQVRLALHPEGAAHGETGEASGEGGVMVAVGSIRSRQDAVRALEAVAEFFQRNEPSSPVPLLVDRAKRLVAKDFLEVLADVAPEALASARAAGGIRD
jgi:type VI secretion system protein ImpA